MYTVKIENVDSWLCYYYNVNIIFIINNYGYDNLFKIDRAINNILIDTEILPFYFGN